MNMAFYGHNRTFVTLRTDGDKLVTDANAAGIKLVEANCKRVLENALSGSNTINLGLMEDDNYDEYRRDYYELSYEGRSINSRYIGHKEGTIPNDIFYAPPNADTPCDILVVLDEGFGGLDVPVEQVNPKCVLWASNKSLPDPEQFAKVADNCLLMLNADVLRNVGAMISRQISWERSVAELIEELQVNPDISHLLSARYIFITFSYDGGVFIIKKPDGGLQASLILTHGGAEGAIMGRGNSEMPNMHSTLVSMLAYAGFMIAMRREALELYQHSGVGIFDFVISALHRGSPDADVTVVLGAYLRELLEAAEGLIAINNEGTELVTADRDWQAFPIPMSQVYVGEQLAWLAPHDWTVTNYVGNKQIYDVAFDYVQKGAEVIDGLPQLSFGALTTVDRWEIEAYQNIRNLILDYNSNRSVRPLSIAVFGSPGSGKSFGVTQIAENILPGRVQKLEFNVSQFISPLDLGVAFQKVRDVILEGKLPLVFFDEFDSENLMWVKNFLMPMQDGRFRDESGEHPLGKCILVFAGGTAPDFETFSAPLTSKDKEVRQAFKNIKGPDFISRLKGTINVLGPNPQNEDDKNYVLRRALLLRSLCERNLAMQGNIAPISPAIIRAMLLISEFRHGARAMEAILDASRNTPQSWEPSMLPFASQLGLYVDADEFLELVRR